MTQHELVKQISIATCRSSKRTSQNFREHRNPRPFFCGREQCKKLTVESSENSKLYPWVLFQHDQFGDEKLLSLEFQFTNSECNTTKQQKEPNKVSDNVFRFFLVSGQAGETLMVIYLNSSWFCLDSNAEIPAFQKCGHPMFARTSCCQKLDRTSPIFWYWNSGHFSFT